MLMVLDLSRGPGCLFRGCVGEGMMRAEGPTCLWGCEPLTLVLSVVRSLHSRSRAQQGSEAAVEPPVQEQANLPSKVHPYLVKAT